MKPFGQTPLRFQLYQQGRKIVLHRSRTNGTSPILFRPNATHHPSASGYHEVLLLQIDYKLRQIPPKAMDSSFFWSLNPKNNRLLLQ